MPREYDQSGYPCDPIRLKNNDHLWAYVEKRGLCVVVDGRGIVGYIPWSDMALAVDDHTNAKDRRPKKRKAR